MRWEDFSYVVLDFETTGLDPLRGESICEIGALKVKGKKIIESFSCLVKPQRPIPLLVSNLTGISNDMVKDAPYFDAVADEFMDFLDQLPLFAYNIKFDAGFLKAELKRLGKNPPANILVDILFICRKLFGADLNKFSLKEVADFLQINTVRLHRALDDAYLAFEVLQRVLDFLIKRGVRTPDVFLSLFSMPDCNLPGQGYNRNLLEEALKKKELLKMKYFSYANLSFSEFRAVPLKIEESKSCLYLLARCAGEENPRTFNLRRLVEVNRI